MDFLQASRNELKKTTWPGKREVVGTTVVVVVFVILLGVFLAVADYIMRSAIWWALGVQ